MSSKNVEHNVSGEAKYINEQLKKETHASLEFRMEQAKNYMDAQFMDTVFNFFGAGNTQLKDHAQRKQMAGQLLQSLSPMINEIFEVLYNVRLDLEAAEKEQRIILFRSALMIDKLKRNNLYDGEASKLPNRE